MRSGPQRRAMARGDWSTISTAVRSACDQPEVGPSGVCDQSSVRTSSPICPPPAGQVSHTDFFGKPMTSDIVEMLWGRRRGDGTIVAGPITDGDAPCPNQL